MRLFEKVPARRKFLKAPAAETREVLRAVTRAGLGIPGVAFAPRLRRARDPVAAFGDGAGRAAGGSLRRRDRRARSLRGPERRPRTFRFREPGIDDVRVAPTAVRVRQRPAGGGPRHRSRDPRRFPRGDPNGPASGGVPVPDRRRRRGGRQRFAGEDGGAFRAAVGCLSPRLSRAALRARFRQGRAPARARSAE